MSAEAFVVRIDALLIAAIADPDSDRAVRFKKETEVALEEAGLRGVKLGLVTDMTWRDIEAACEPIFGKHFIKRFDVVVPSDQACMGWFGLPRIATALTLLGVPAHCAIAIVCSEEDATEAYEAGIGERRYLDEASEQDALDSLKTPRRDTTRHLSV